MHPMSPIISNDIRDTCRIKAVRIDANGHMVRVSGRNAQGKSSIFDAIELAIRGAKARPHPVHTGADRASIQLTLRDLIVNREITPDGGDVVSVSVRQEDGTAGPKMTKAKSSEILKTLLGNMVDPSDFLLMDGQKLFTHLCKLTGLDFVAINDSIKELRSTKKRLGDEWRTLKAEADSLPNHTDVPDAEVDLSAQAKALQDALAVNAANEKVRSRVDQARRDHEAIVKSVKDLDISTSPRKIISSAWNVNSKRLVPAWKS